MIPALTAESVTSGYGNGPAIHSISLELKSGEILGVLGPNGAGKTTLLRALSGLLPLTAGEVRLESVALRDVPPRERARRIAWVQQKESTPFSFTVREWVEMGRYCHTGPVRKMTALDREAVDRAIEACCLEELSTRPLNKVSGGEAQRAHIARALAQEATLLFLDEPLTHLDLKYQAEVYRILQRQSRLSNRGVLCVLHDLTFASAFCDRLLCLRDGRQFHCGSTREILEEGLLSELYGTPIRKAEIRFQPSLGEPEWNPR